jgi:hypothetical protein
MQVLRARPEDAKSMEGARTRIEQQSSWVPSSAGILEVRAAIERAFREADVLGVLGATTEGRRGWPDDLDTLGFEQRAKQRAVGRPVALTGCGLNHELLPVLPELLAERRLSLVSCRDIGPVVEEKWNVHDVVVYQVPSQYCARHVDGAYEAAMHDVPIWPDAHERIRSDLRVREPGEVFLVGVGIFGKDLCIEIRDRGGIALDMGASLDVIAGKVTRGFIKRIVELEEDSEGTARLAALRNGPESGERVDRLIETVTQYMR